MIAAVLAAVLVLRLDGALVSSDPCFPPLFNASGVIISTLIRAFGALIRYTDRLRLTGCPRCPRRPIVLNLTYTPAVLGANGGQATALIAMNAVAAGMFVGPMTKRPGTRARYGDGDSCRRAAM
jgi:hypothetical protein